MRCYDPQTQMETHRNVIAVSETKLEGISPVSLFPPRNLHSVPIRSSELNSACSAGFSSMALRTFSTSPQRLCARPPCLVSDVHTCVLCGDAPAYRQCRNTLPQPMHGDSHFCQRSQQPEARRNPTRPSVRCYQGICTAFITH